MGSPSGSTLAETMVTDRLSSVSAGLGPKEMVGFEGIPLMSREVCAVAVRPSVSVAVSVMSWWPEVKASEVNRIKPVESERVVLSTPSKLEFHAKSTLLGRSSASETVASNTTLAPAPRIAPEVGSVMMTSGGIPTL